MASPYLKIKTLLLERDETISSLAREFSDQGIDCSREQLSMTIRGVRPYPHLREALADHFNTSVERLFGKAAARQAHKRGAA